MAQKPKKGKCEIIVARRRKQTLSAAPFFFYHLSEGQGREQTVRGIPRCADAAANTAGIPSFIARHGIYGSYWKCAGVFLASAEDHSEGKNTLATGVA